MNKPNSLLDEYTTNEIVSAISSLLFIKDNSDLAIPYKEFLRCDKLNYSLESLKYVDEFLNIIKKKLPSLTDDQYTKVVLRCGAYCGEVIKRNAKVTFDWITFEDAIKVGEETAIYGKSALTIFILSRDKGKNLIFPMAKVDKYLNNDTSDSLHFYAKIIKSL